MTVREFDPARLDVAAFAKEEATLQGHWPLQRLVRLHDAAMEPADAGSTSEVSWQVRGEQVRVAGTAGQPCLHLTASARLTLQCQRCLGPVDTPLQVERRFLFVAGEDAAAQLDADSEDDVLALTRALDLHELVEDELLLALPLVPRHETCPQPLPLPSEPEHDEEAAPHPFAALAALKRGRPPN